MSIKLKKMQQWANFKAQPGEVLKLQISFESKYEVKLNLCVV